MPTKEKLLSQTIEHIDITKHNVVGLVEAMQHMAYSVPAIWPGRPRFTTGWSATRIAASFCAWPAR